MLRKRVAAIGAPCWICGLPIAYDLPAGHPLSYELDELIPVSKGGSPDTMDNCHAVHRACNQWRSNKSVRTVEQTKAEAVKKFGGWRSPLEFVQKARAVSKGMKRPEPVRRPDGTPNSREW